MMSTHGDTEVVSAVSLRNWPLPQPGGSKHSRGHVLVVGGSPSTPGAAMLAGLAALRVGAGVLALAVAASTAIAVATAVPEASVTGLTALDDNDATSDAQLTDVLASTGSVLVGPGITDVDAARSLVDAALEAQTNRSGSLVLDAFALGVLRDVVDEHELRGPVVLTPNTTEAGYLLARSADELDDAEPTDIAAAIADRYGAVVTYASSVAEPGGRTWTVPAGHPGLGTSGSGDVLAGIVAGLLARGAEPAQAACWASYLHAAAGDRLAARVGRLGFLARELVDELPLVIVQTEA